MDAKSAYARAGVDISAGQTAVEMMKDAIAATYGPAVLSSVGSFGGLYSASALQSMASPVLVASTDGVGTKTKVASRMGEFAGLGRDLVNHCVNDILVQGARPLFFLDYIAAARLEPAVFAAIVTGVAAACRENGCALLGGESAEMPGVYEPGAVDLAGTIVGVVERDAVIDGRAIAPGDAIIALPSSGPHTNGYTLLRSVLDELDWHAPRPALGGSIGAALLAPHRAYLAEITMLQDAGVELLGLAHITGGGVIDNLPRILPAGCGARIERGTWPVPPIFELVRQVGHIDDAEMWRVFNMGLGMLVVVRSADAARVIDIVADATRVGDIVAGGGVSIVPSAR